MIFRKNTGSGPEAASDVFAPVADLMVGVVFIFIILTLTLSLNFDPEGRVSRSDFDARLAELSAARAQLDATRGQLEVATARLEQARALEGVRTAELNRLGGFVRYVRDQGIVPFLDRLTRADQARAHVLLQLRRRLLEQGVDASADPAAGTLALPASRLFGSGRSDPSPEGRETILKLGRVMTEVLPCYAAGAAPACAGRDGAESLSAIYIEGHTDATPFGGTSGRFRNNWDLSAGRAIEAYTLLRSQFDQVRDLRNASGQPLVGVSGYADTRPASTEPADRGSPESMDKDRRIEVRLVMSTDAELVGAVLRELRTRLEDVRDVAP